MLCLCLSSTCQIKDLEFHLYFVILTLMPDLNSTVKWSVKTVIFSMSLLTSSLSKTVTSVSCWPMKSCSPLIRFMVSVWWWLSTAVFSFACGAGRIRLRWHCSPASCRGFHDELLLQFLHPNPNTVRREGVGCDNGIGYVFLQAGLRNSFLPRRIRFKALSVASSSTVSFIVRLA